MARIDCSNIYNFVNEWERRRNTNPDIYAPFSVFVDRLMKDNLVLEDYVNDLQEWSDANQQENRKEKFKRILEENGFEPARTCNGEIPVIYCENYTECEDCQYFWNEVVE